MKNKKRCHNNPPKEGAEREAAEVIELSLEDSRIVSDEDDDATFMESKPVVLTGQAAADFADIVLSPAPEISPALRRAAERYRQTVISE